MTKQTETFYDDIIKALEIRGEAAKFANLSPETAKELFADNIKQAAAPQFVPNPGVQAPVAQGMTFPSVPPSIPKTAPEVPQNQVTDSGDITQMDMPALRGLCNQCTKCELHKGRKNVVFGTGNSQADLMFIGESPGRDEDIQGIPFVGEAGQLLTKMINAMQFQRSDVYIANIVKCHPPNNRNPEDIEAETCLPYLKCQIHLVNPRVIVILGAVPLKYLLGKTGITKRRGVWDNYEGIQVMPTFHPAYLLRNASAKKQVWEDLQKVMHVFGKSFHPVQKRT